MLTLLNLSKLIDWIWTELVLLFVKQFTAFSNIFSLKKKSLLYSSATL
jgi:hypothetical protein